MFRKFDSEYPICSCTDFVKSYDSFYIILKKFSIKNMPSNKELRKELILKNPNDSATKLLDIAKGLKISNRKTEFLKEVRELRKLPEPSLAKKERSIPLKHRTSLQKQRIAKRKPKAKPKVKAKVKAKAKPRKVQTILKPKEKIPFEQTKFGKIVRDLQDTHRISEKKAIIHARELLKIDKSDYDIINQKDVQILLARTP